MTTTVKISEANTHLSELLAGVEAGEDFVITRGNDRIAHVTRIRRQFDMQLMLAEVGAARLKATIHG